MVCTLTRNKVLAASAREPLQRLVRLRQFADPFKQLKHRQPQRHRDDLHRIQRWVGLSVFDATEIGLIKAALLTELDLR